MKQFFLLALAIPVLAFGQTKPKTPTKSATKTTTQAAEAKPADGFIVRGSVKGFPEGTSVALLNGQTGAPESETTVHNNTFTFKGQAATPDFKVILFDKKPPYVTLFLDNSDVTVSASKDSLEFATVNGSTSHSEYIQLSQQLMPYAKLFGENAVYDSVAMAGATNVASNFVKQYPASYVAPLAIIRYTQLTDDAIVPEQLYALLAPPVKSSPMGAYVAQQLAELKKNAIGTVLADFSQPDTSGNPVSLASYRGKYVLVDFWASWCRPCRQENPNVVANFEKFRDKNFTVLGVSLDQAKPAWVNAIKMDGLNWGHVSDLKGWTNAVAQQFQITSIPQNFLIDPNGKIIAKNLRGPALERKLASLLK